MAKWGEGDPRWIVEDRADATNVNNWHWTEKNATAWSKDKLTQLLKGLKIANSKYECRISDITRLEGEAVANNRKAKLIFFYEWEVKLEWKGNLIGSDKSHKGKFEVLNLSEENDPKDLDFDVTTTSDKSEAYDLKEFMRKTGAEEIRQKLAQYISDLKQEFSQGMILPSSEGAPNPKNSTTPKNDIQQEMSKPVIEATKNKANSPGVKIPCKTITEKETFKCRASEIYNALTEQEMVQAFTRNEAKIKAEKGEGFVLFDGNVTGHFTNLKPYEQIKMQWRFSSWPKEHFSTVTLNFEQKEDCTEMSLKQTGVPENELDRTKQGWARYYWQSIKQTFGFGANLF